MYTYYSSAETIPKISNYRLNLFRKGGVSVEPALLKPAGLLDSLLEPWSGNLVLPVTLNTSPKLRGRATEFPRSDSNRLVILFTRHTLQLNGIVDTLNPQLPIKYA